MHKHFFIFLAFLAFLLSSCDDKEDLSPANRILQIAIKEDAKAQVVIDSAEFTVKVAIDENIDRKSITPYFVISPKASISPLSGVAHDFTAPVEYTVTAENGKQQKWLITVSNASGEKKILSASIPALFQVANGVVGANSLTFTLPYGTDFSNITIDATLSAGATATPAFGIPHDYTVPVTHTITAANGTKATYTVTLQHAAQETGVRSVWITNVSSDVLMSESALTTAVNKLSELNFNTICVSVYNKSQTLFQSETLANVLGTTALATVMDGCSWGDVLGKLIEKAHAKNIKVIAWFEYGFASHYSGLSSPLYDKKPGWISKEISDASKGKNTTDTVSTEKNSFYWLNSFHPEVQTFVKNMILECVRKYPNLDGVQGDDRLPALPAEGGYDKYTRNLYKQETGKDVPLVYNETSFLNWKVNKLTAFATELYNAVKALRSTCLVTWAPGVRGWAKDNYLQDWPQWVNNGKADWVSPQLYRGETQGIEAYATLVDADLYAVFNTEALRKKYVPGMLVRNGSTIISDAFLAKMIQYNRSRSVYSESTWFYEAIPAKYNAYKALYPGVALFPGF